MPSLPHEPADPPGPGDPRIEIPDVLKTSAPPSTAPPTRESGIAGMARAWGVAFDFIFTICAGAGLGWLYDRWQSTAPTGLLIGFALGFVFAFIRIVRYTMAQERREAEERQRRSSQTPPNIDRSGRP